jgi:Flp pilus assembly protein TadD
MMSEQMKREWENGRMGEWEGKAPAEPNGSAGASPSQASPSHSLTHPFSHSPILSLLCLPLLCLTLCGCGTLRQVGREQFIARRLDEAKEARLRNDNVAALMALQDVSRVAPHNREVQQLQKKELILRDAARRAYFFQGRWQDAVTFWEQAGIDPLPFEESLSLADAYDRSGNVKRAEEIYVRLVRRHPKDARAYNGLGYFYAQRGIKLDEAVRLLQTSLRLIPEDDEGTKGSVQDSLGWAYYKQGKIELARRTIEEASRLEPDQPEILYHLGVIHRRLQRKEDARRALERALNLLSASRLFPSLSRSLAVDVRSELRHLGVVPVEKSSGWRGFLKELIGSLSL